MDTLVDESAHKFLHIGEVATTIVAHVNDQAIGCGKMAQDQVQIAIAHADSEVTIVHIADVVGQDLVFDARNTLVVKVKIMLVDGALIVVDRILFPNPVARHIVRGDEVGVSVAQFLEHFSTQFKEFLIGHVVAHTSTVSAVDFVPIHVFVGKETVVLIHDLPQCLEVAHSIVVPFLFVVAARHGQCGQDDEQGVDVTSGFHFRFTLRNSPPMPMTRL